MRYFVDTGDGVEYFANEEDAEKCLDKAWDFWLGVASDDNEWPEEADRVCLGKIVIAVHTKGNMPKLQPVRQ
jgi:hypothetical protein